HLEGTCRRRRPSCFTGAPATHRVKLGEQRQRRRVRARGCSEPAKWAQRDGYVAVRIPERGSEHAIRSCHGVVNSRDVGLTNRIESYVAHSLTSSGSSARGTRTQTAWLESSVLDTCWT